MPAIFGRRPYRNAQVIRIREKDQIVSVGQTLGSNRRAAAKRGVEVGWKRVIEWRRRDLFPYARGCREAHVRLARIRGQKQRAAAIVSVITLAHGGIRETR